jgi:hypothetical protein
MMTKIVVSQKVYLEEEAFDAQIIQNLIYVHPEHTQSSGYV